MVDNFSQIQGLLAFESEDDFYFLQLIQRRKEHPELGSNNRVINTYFIKSKEHLLHLQEEIKSICKVTNSRAYINLNKRSFKKMSMRLMKNICDHIMECDYEHLYRSYTTVCGQYSDDKNKTFLIDIDGDENLRKINDMVRFIETECEPIGEKFKAVIPTKNGKHIIVSAFNLQKFKQAYPDVDIHKNNPTILYIP